MPDSDNGDSPAPASPPAPAIQPQEPRNADAPFNDESGDIIFRSSDNVDFHVHKVLLSIASPVFRDMFSLPQPSQTNDRAGSLPIVDLTEDARTIKLLLQCCYPVPPPELTELKDIRAVLDVGRKFDMSAAIRHGKIALDHYVENDVMSVFAIACRHQFSDICAKAARRSLFYSLDALDSPELVNISGAQFFALMQYHLRCCKATSTFISSRKCLSQDTGGMPIRSTSRTIFGSGNSVSCPRCTHDTNGEWRGPPELWRYLDRVEKTLKIRPHSSAALLVVNNAVWASSSLQSCGCGQNYSHHRFIERLADQIDAVVAEIEIPQFC